MKNHSSKVIHHLDEEKENGKKSNDDLWMKMRMLMCCVMF